MVANVSSVSSAAPPVGRPGDPDWNRTRVDQTVIFALKNLGAHTRAAVSFDLYILKSWDGNSRQAGPDQFMARVSPKRALRR